MTAFGVVLPIVSGSGAPHRFGHVAGVAAAAEDAGFTSVWVGGRPSGSPGPAPGARAGLEAITLLGALAVSTHRVLLGWMPDGGERPSPGVLAKLVTTLDVLSAGRAILGLVPAGREEGEGAGAQEPGGRADLDGLEDTVRVCRALFAGDDVTYTGVGLRLDHARNQPPPVQPGGPRVAVGGGERTLRLAARYADKWVVRGDPATLRRSVGLLRRHCAEVARDPEEIEVVWLAPLTLTSSTEESRALRRASGTHRSGGPAGGALIGRPEEIPGHVADHLAAGADEVLFSPPAVGADALTALGRALGLGSGSP